MNLLIVVGIAFVLKPTKQEVYQVRLNTGGGGSGNINACTLDTLNAHFVCITQTSLFQLSYIPVTSPYTRVYDTMSSTNHNYVWAMQYHQPTNTIYMGTGNRLVRYNNQLPTVTPQARTQTHVYGSGIYSAVRVSNDGAFVFGGVGNVISRCSLTLSCVDFSVAGSSVFYILNRLTGNHMVVLSSGTPTSYLYHIDVASLSVSSQYVLLSLNARLLTISQTDNDIVYIGITGTPSVIQTRFNGISNAQLAQVPTFNSNLLKNLHVVAASTCMIVGETDRIYLIDLDNFAAGAIASTIVTIVSGSYPGRSLSIDMLAIGIDRYFVVGSNAPMDRARL